MITLIIFIPVLDARGGLPRAHHTRTLGCQMSVHDSEHMAGLLERVRYLCVEGVPEATSRVTGVDDGGVNVVIINTCLVYGNTATWLFGSLDQLTAVKREHPDIQVAMTGCLVQQMGEGIVERTPWADVVFDTHNLDVLPTLFECVRYNSAAAVEFGESLGVFPSTLPTRCEFSYAAWVSITVGCNDTCTFCIVPSLRGKWHDRRPGDALAEVKAVATQSAVEVTLLGQNVNFYGVGFGDRGVSARLLRVAGSVEGIGYVHFIGPHSAAFTDDVIEAMATTEAVIPSLYMPLQFGSDRVLHAMRRSYHTQRLLSILDKVHTVMPEAAITTDIAVGFPGETEEDFQATLDVVEQARFISTYTFEHSPHPGTPVADHGDRVPTEVVKDRYRRLDASMCRIAHGENERQEGRVAEMFVVEGEGRRDMVTARTSGRVADNRLVHVVLSEGPAEDDYAGGVPCLGDIVTVRITHDAPYNLIADSARYGRELDPRAATIDETLKPGDHLWLDDDPTLFQV